MHVKILQRLYRENIFPQSIDRNLNKNVSYDLINFFFLFIIDTGV